MRMIALGDRLATGALRQQVQAEPEIEQESHGRALTG